MPFATVVVDPVQFKAQLTVAPGIGAFVFLSFTTPVTLPFPAALYGPTNGPPSPTGGLPAGWIESVLVSERARKTLTRPLPVWSWVPAGSAVRAIRFTIIPFARDGSAARINAAVPATMAAEADVPLHVVYV